MSHKASGQKHNLTRDLTPKEREKIIRHQDKRKAKPERGAIQYPDPLEQVELTETPAHFVHPGKHRS